MKKKRFLPSKVRVKIQRIYLRLERKVKEGGPESIFYKIKRIKIKIKTKKVFLSIKTLKVKRF